VEAREVHRGSEDEVALVVQIIEDGERSFSFSSADSVAPPILPLPPIIASIVGV